MIFNHNTPYLAIATAPTAFNSINTLIKKIQNRIQLTTPNGIQTIYTYTQKFSFLS